MPKSNVEEEFLRIRKQPLFIAIVVSLFEDIKKKIRARFSLRVLFGAGANDNHSLEGPLIVQIGDKRVNISKEVVNAAFAIFEPSSFGGIFHSSQIRDVATARACSEILSRSGIDSGGSFEEYVAQTAKQRKQKTDLLASSLRSISRFLGGEPEVKSGEYFVHLSGKAINVSANLEVIYERLMHEKDNTLSYFEAIEKEARRIQKQTCDPCEGIL